MVSPLYAPRSEGPSAGRAQKIAKHLILVSVTAGIPFCRTAEAHRIEKNLTRQIIRQKIIRALHLVLMRVHELLIEQRSLDHRHVQATASCFVLERATSAAPLGSLAGERNHDYNILAKLRHRVRQLAHAEPMRASGCRGAELKSPANTADARMPRRSNCARSWVWLCHAVQKGGRVSSRKSQPDCF